MKSKFKKMDYNKLSRNCNHFAEELCIRILGKGLPSHLQYVNRPARVGNFLNHILSKNVKKFAVLVPESKSLSSAAPPSDSS